MADPKYGGLSSSQVPELQKQYGKNLLTPETKHSFIKKALHIIAEPMFLLLLAAAVIYFVLGEPRDGAIMLVFVLAVISIDIIQEWKTDRTLSALKELSAPHVAVMRDGREQSIKSEELVPGDLMLLYEGVKIPADGTVVYCADLCVDESTLTGEAEGVWKLPEGEAVSDGYWRKDRCYAGTLVTQGTAGVRVEHIGAATEYGRIGERIAQAPDRPTPLEKQTAKLVKTCAVIAIALLALVALVTFINLSGLELKQRLIESTLAGITLAMAMIPEEFPVIMAVFLSMGAWRLARKNSLVRRLSSVETLGAVSVLCVDKTGTITENRMSVHEIWAVSDEDTLVETMGLGCETDAYDPMEKAMLTYCEKRGVPKAHLFGGELAHEYAFTNELKMMGHVWLHDGELLAACKGSPERILDICALTDAARAEADSRAEDMARRGLRVIAVGIQRFANAEEIPEEITGCELTLLGLVGLEDPPREGVKRDIAVCAEAGVRVVMITGDNGITASAIARQVGIEHSNSIITGDMLSAMSDDELKERVKHTNVFSRVIPEHKLRIVKALRENGEVVAMTGDGVNDAPALKYADIGVAMGMRGSEVAREAADLILMDDNFSTIVDTVRDGRRIYDNIRKAVGYVFSIHIPIALASLLAPMLGVPTASLFLLPLHVVLLELIIDPTCSVVLERQPAETSIMQRPPRDPNEKLLPASGLLKSVVQGLMMFIASFGLYYAALCRTGDAALARSLGLSVLAIANLLLVNVNSSEIMPVWRSVGLLIKDKVMWLTAGGTMAGLIAALYTPLNGLLKLSPLSIGQLGLTLGVAAAAVLWYEIVKAVKRRKLG